MAIEMHFLSERLRDLRAVQGTPLQPRDAGDPVSRQVDRRRAAMTVDQALPLLENFPSIASSCGRCSASASDTSSRTVGDDAERRRGPARQTREGAVPPRTGTTLYILDEPTTGLHFEDAGTCWTCCISSSSGQHGRGDRAQPRRHPIGRSCDRPRSGRRIGRRPGDGRGHAGRSRGHESLLHRTVPRRTAGTRSGSRRGIVPYRPALDGIRAIAVPSVVAYHLQLPWMRGGFLGVDVFFVLSGYLITSLLLAEHAATGRISLRAVLDAQSPPAASGAAVADRRGRARRAGAAASHRMAARDWRICSGRCSTARTGIRSSTSQDYFARFAASRRCGTCGRSPSRSSSISCGR